MDKCFHLRGTKENEKYSGNMSGKEDLAILDVDSCSYLEFQTW